jgi:hypothetical protein
MFMLVGVPLLVLAAAVLLLVGAPLLVLVLGMAVLVTLFHLVFSLPFWLVLGGIAAYLLYRRGGRRRSLGQGGGYGYLERRARW